MTKPISTRTHGIIDYVYGATLIGLPFMLGCDRRAARLSVSAGLATIGMSLLTKYEFGAVPLLPMKAHLAVDAVESSMLMGAPKMLGRDDRGAGRVLAALGALGAAVGSMTQTESPLERRELPA